MRRRLVVLLLAGAAAAAPEDPCARFHRFDRTGDGIVEIEELATVAREDGPGADAPLVLLVVEGRLLEVGRETVLPGLRQWQADVAAEGFRSALVAADLYHGPVHQDGETLLALREYFRAVRAEDPKFAGVVLVGAFPEAYLVRTVNWRKRGKLTVDGEKRSGPLLRTVPEGVAHTCDLVLADLDGHWERLYTAPRTELPYVVGLFRDGVPPGGGVTTEFERGTRAFEDFFHVNDGHILVEEACVVAELRALRLTPLDAMRDEECSGADHERPNVIAHPDILVSRINARGVATSPEMERRLIHEYFARNHGYRTGALKVPFRPASLAHGLGSGYRLLQRASKSWAGPAEPGFDVRGKPRCSEAFAWLERPAVLRTIRAHSNRFGSAFEKGWLSGRSLRRHWLEGSRNDTASFYIHIGCEAVSPARAESKPYSDPGYGRDNSAAGLLFFAHGLALVGRAKVFYDEPRGFCRALGAGETFGAAWARYFEIESMAESWRKVGGDIGRKRSYFWSVLGDWTLRLRQPG